MSSARSVKPEEVIAEAFLRATSGQAAIDRPQERAASPNLLVGGSIAVEVRPLSPPGRTGRNIEEVRKPTIAALRRAISEHNKRRAKSTLALTVRPIRPLPAEETLRAELDQALSELRAAGRESMVRLPCGITLEAAKVQQREGVAFTYAGTLDQEATGAVVAMYVEAIKRALDAAQTAVAKVKERYPTWWLLMVDLIDCPLTRAEATAISDGLGPVPLFDRLMVVHPSSGLLLRVEAQPAA
jgi:hypothetical protein